VLETLGSEPRESKEGSAAKHTNRTKHQSDSAFGNGKAIEKQSSY